MKNFFSFQILISLYYSCDFDTNLLSIFTKWNKNSIIESFFYFFLFNKIKIWKESYYRYGNCYNSFIELLKKLTGNKKVYYGNQIKNVREKFYVRICGPREKFSIMCIYIW